MMQNFENDRALMEAFRNMDPMAESILFKQFFRSMCLLAETITGQLLPAEDIVAESFIKLFDKRAEFEAIDNIKAFLYVTVRNSSYTYKTTQKRHEAIHARIATGHDGAEDDLSAAVELEMIRAQLLEEIYQEIENLPPQCRRIAKMIFWEGKNTDSISQELHISPQTVRTQKARAIQLIKNQLFKDDKWAGMLLLIIYLQKFS
jgi:RNA polymerase sigma factor (sigma-70 family)